MSTLGQLPAASAVAVIRLRSLGDCVLTTPALHLLRRARPDLRIGVVVEDRFRALFERSPDIDAVLSPSVSAVRRWHPQLCLNLHGGTRSMILTAASGARFRAGFSHFRGAALYNVLIPTAQKILGVVRKVHTAEHIASAVFALGVPESEIPAARLTVPVFTPTAVPYAVIHPFAARLDKAWPAPNFQSVAEFIDRQLGLEPVFIAGPGDDTTPFSRFRTLAGAPLEDTISLIAGASLFIGNDSGPAHIAAALKVPVVVLFGPSDAKVWAPWRVRSRVLQANPLDGISVEQVTATAAELYQSVMVLRES